MPEPETAPTSSQLQHGQDLAMLWSAQDRCDEIAATNAGLAMQFMSQVRHNYFYAYDKREFANLCGELALLRTQNAAEIERMTDAR